MSSHCRELRLEEMLADSVIKAVMEADGVDPRELETELQRTAALLRATRRTSKSRDLWVGCAAGPYSAARIAEIPGAA